MSPRRGDEWVLAHWLHQVLDLAEEAKLGLSRHWQRALPGRAHTCSFVSSP